MRKSVNGKSSAADLLGVSLVDIAVHPLKCGGIKSIAHNRRISEYICTGEQFLGIQSQHMGFEFIPDIVCLFL